MPSFHDMERKFSRALKSTAEQGRIPIIVDIKTYSPKEGDLLRGHTCQELALIFKNAGAPALSVVTERDHFHGSLRTLGQVAKVSGLPVLRKDFITDVRGLEDTVNAGASAVLLICSMLSTKQLKSLFLAAHELGLEVLVEVHTEKELEVSAELGAKLIGVNNRDIINLELDNGTVHQMLELLRQAPKDALIINESGIYTLADVCAAMDAGADALLIGTALLQAEDPAEYYKLLCNGAVCPY